MFSAPGGVGTKAESVAFACIHCCEEARPHRNNTGKEAVLTELVIVRLDFGQAGVEPQLAMKPTSEVVIILTVGACSRKPCSGLASHAMLWHFFDPFVYTYPKPPC